MKSGLLCLVMAVVVCGAAVHARADDSSETTTKRRKHRVIVVDEDGNEISNARVDTSQYRSRSNAPKFDLRPSFTYNFISPSAVNTLYSDVAQQQGIQSAYKIGGAPGFSIAGDYAIVPQFLVGLRMDWFAASTDTIKLDAAGTTSVQSTLSGLPLYATATFLQPVSSTVSLGVTGGVGVPAFYHLSNTLTVPKAQAAQPAVGAAAAANTSSSSETYSAMPITALGLAFVNVELARHFALRAEAGYRFLSAGQMTLADDFGDEKAGTVLMENGKAVPVDASAFFMGASAVINL